MQPATRGRLEIHAAALLWGLTGPIGKALEPMPSVVIVFSRTLLGAIALLLIVLATRDSQPIQWRRDGVRLILIGGLLAVHWWFFFLAVQVSTVATGLLALATIPVMVSFLEPIFFRRPLRQLDLATALLVVVGMLLIVDDYDLSNPMTLGVVFGLLAAATAALFTVLNKQIIATYPAMSIAFYNLLIAAVVSAPWALWELRSPADGPTFTMWQGWLLLMLALLCTAVSHALFLRGMRFVEAHYATIVGCLEPLYAILFAALFLAEIPTLRMIAGGTVILLATWFATVVSARREKAALIPGAIVGEFEATDGGDQD